tara:strand:- start:129055 stop:130983 length:1929 start_codon:yes stop_codon:yes gene_type:complete
LYNKLHLNYEGGNLIVTFTNKYSKKYHQFCATFKSKGARADFENSRWLLPRFLTRDFCREARKKNYYLDLSHEIQKEFNVNKDGYSKKEIQKRKEWLENHVSNAKDDLEFNEEVLEMPYPLLPYQRAGISYFFKDNRKGRGLLADDMGLGKTIQGIGFSKFCKKDWPVIVIAPASLLLNWKKEFLKWLPNDLEEDDVHVMKTGKHLPKGKVVICSFQYTIKRKEELLKFLGLRGVVIIDEAHNIKNLKAQRTDAIIEIAHRAKRYLPMTGTPLLNRPEELFSILHSIDPIEWGDYYEFIFKYCDAQKITYNDKKTGKKRTQIIMSGVSNDKELFKNLRENYMCRRLKKDVLTQLPKKRRYTLSLDANSKDVKETKDFLDYYYKLICYSLIENNFELDKTKSFIFSENTVDAGDGLFQAYQMTGRSKIKSLCQWVSDKIDGDLNKLIIFGHHSSFLDSIQEQIDTINSKKGKKAKKIGYMRIDGKTSKEKRFKNQEDFQNNPDCNVAILSINAANSGLTLTAANVLIMGELPWTPGVARQAEDRIHRIGQEMDVDIYYTIADDTLDGALWNMLKVKSTVASNILDDGEGDEMEEDIEISSTDLMSVLLINIKKEIEEGNIDPYKYAKEYEKFKKEQEKEKISN